MEHPDPEIHQRYQSVAARPEFEELRRRYLRFVVPATVTFMAWYVVYVACNNWARGFMNQQLVGHINVAVVFGLLQFVSTFAIAVLYARYSNRHLDPLADELREDFESSSPRGAYGPGPGRSTGTER